MCAFKPYHVFNGAYYENKFNIEISIHYSYSEPIVSEDAKTAM